MPWLKSDLQIATSGKGLYPITQMVHSQLQSWHVQDGLCTLFIVHTSASLVINESYDPTAREDLEAFLERLAPENQSWHHHNAEGVDDSSAHLRAALLPTSLTIPVEDGKLALGTWQGVYVFEHRSRVHQRVVRMRMLI